MSITNQTSGLTYKECFTLTLLEKIYYNTYKIEDV